MRSTYKKEDVTLLLKDITGLIEPRGTEEREKMIQKGRHYSEMLPLEYVPSEDYMRVYREALKKFSKPVALAVGKLSDKIVEKRGENIVLVSLARAGTPIGILIKRYLRKKYDLTIPHYSISIIRDKGIDENAMDYLLKRYQPEQLLFVDGWIGKGAILKELQKAIAKYEKVCSEIAVISDPANVTELCGTHEDILIPSSCLNSTVSGLISRTVLRSDLIGEKDFHGAVFYEELKDSDLSNEFLDLIEAEFEMENPSMEEEAKGDGMSEVMEIARKFQIDNIHFIKPGIGETTRVLLRRIPWKILIDEEKKGSPQLEHLIRLAEEKNVPVEYYGFKRYQCCGIIKKMADA